MVANWLVVFLGLALLCFALWRWVRATRALFESRRHGALMAHLDWTRNARPSRIAPQRKGALATLLGR